MLCYLPPTRLYISPSDTSPHRHPHLVLQRRATRQRRRQQDPDRQQVRLGGEAGGQHGTRAGACQRARHPIHGGQRQEQHQRREGFLQPSRRYQEEDCGHTATAAASTTIWRERWQWRGRCGWWVGQELLLNRQRMAACVSASLGSLKFLLRQVDIRTGRSFGVWALGCESSGQLHLLYSNMTSVLEFQIKWNVSRLH